MRSVNPDRQQHQFAGQLRRDAVGQHRHQRARRAHRSDRRQRRAPERDAELERLLRRKFLQRLALHAGQHRRRLLQRLSTILLNNTITNTSYTDASPTDGSIYSYFVTATGAGGTSYQFRSGGGGAAAGNAGHVPAFAHRAALCTTNNITLNWSPVPGAVGYVISRATSSGGPYTYLQTVTETTYTDYGLNPAIIYYYRVAAMNDAGVTGNNTDSVNSQQTFPASLTATATNAQITLTWPATTGATSYNAQARHQRRAMRRRPSSTSVHTAPPTRTPVWSMARPIITSSRPPARAAPAAIRRRPAPRHSLTGNGIWISPANGNWSDTANWADGAIASGTGQHRRFQHPQPFIKRHRHAGQRPRHQRPGFRRHGRHLQLDARRHEHPDAGQPAQASTS